METIDRPSHNCSQHRIDDFVEDSTGQNKYRTLTDGDTTAKFSAENKSGRFRK
jgi:hypothetical protein